MCHLLYYLHIRLFQVPVKTLSMIEHSVCLIHRDTLQCSVHCAGVGVVSVADPAALETSCSVIPCRQRRRRWRRGRRRRQGRRQHHQRRQRQGQQQVQRRRQRHRHQRQQQRRRPQLGHHLSHRLAVHHPRCGVVHMYSEL